jgi:iron complex transport system permease protein
MRISPIINPRFFIRVVLLFTGIAFVCLILGLFIGQESLDWQAILYGDTDSSSFQIFFYWRLPEVLLAFLVGGALTTAGVIFQALLQNPLASPYTLGVASGAGFGAVLSLSLPAGFSLYTYAQEISTQDIPTLLEWFVGFASFSQTSLFAFAGALLAIAIVFFLGRTRYQGLSTFHLLLAGVTMSFVFGGMMLFVQYLADPVRTDQMIRWLMADLEISDYRILIFLSVFAFIIYGIVFRHLHTLNIISLGVEMGTSKGVNIQFYYRFFFATASLLTALMVSVAGPIAFVGLIIPHLLRLVIGSDHRVLLPVAILAGGGYLVLCDVLSRTVLFLFGIESKLPVGVITALLGGPIFVLMLRRQH